MEYMSIGFLMAFLPLLFLAYYFVEDKYRNLCLLLGSLFIYFWIEPVFFFLLLTIIFSTYIFGVLIDKFREKNFLPEIALLLGLGIDIVSLVFLKYPNAKSSGIAVFLADKINLVEFLIPFGISIYMLQSISYLVDLYSKKTNVEKNIINLALYVSFFPQMVCGPIVRYTDMQRELQEKEITSTKVSKGYSMFIRGLAKVLLLGLPAFSIWTDIQLLDKSDFSLVTAWFGVIMVSYGIYFYFAGFSDIARGLAKIFGFEFPVNYNFPYSARSTVDFWRKWNISLTMWFKVYVISNIKRGTGSFWANMLKLMLLWVMIGFWHGFHVNFFLWGLYMGFFVILEKLILSTLLEKIPVFLQRIYTFFVVTIGWVIFASTSLVEAADYITVMFGFKNNDFIDETSIYYLISHAFLFVMCLVVSSQKHKMLGIKMELERPKLALISKNIFEIVLFILCVISVVTVNYNL